MDVQLINTEKKTPGEVRLANLFVSLKEGGEAVDFNSTPLTEATKVDCFIPWNIPISNVRDYFGEKIALYFRFVQFFTR